MPVPFYWKLADVIARDELEVKMVMNNKSIANFGLGDIYMLCIYVFVF